MDAWELAEQIVNSLENTGVVFDLNTDERHFIIETVYDSINHYFLRY